MRRKKSFAWEPASESVRQEYAETHNPYESHRSGIHAGHLSYTGIPQLDRFIEQIRQDDK